MAAEPGSQTLDPQQFFSDKIPQDWFTSEPSVRTDREEILVVGALADDASPTAFRESTRDARIAIAAEAELRYRRKVSWAVRHRGDVLRFTSVSVPVMTRLRLDERSVLDGLIDGGIARSRSEAVAWCVRLVGRHQQEWLADLAEATEAVRRVRSEGPE